MPQTPEVELFQKVQLLAAARDPLPRFLDYA
jgi:hypothetical protein